MRLCLRRPALFLALSITASATAAAQEGSEIVHDAEYYVLYSQHADEWAAQNARLDAKLAELREKHGQPPNIVYILWDDTSFGDVGIPAINQIRGFNTPNFNRMAQEGMTFTRMYTEPSCMPSRAAVMTGRHPIRNGMYRVGFPVEYHGLAAQEVTIAEVLSDAGYATAFYGKWHIGDIEEAYPYNQGFDRTLFAPYNQVVSLWNRQGEAANAVLGLYPDQLPEHPYRLDDTFLPNGWVMAIEGEKGVGGREFGGTTNKDYDRIDIEGKRRTLEFIRENAAAEKPFFVAYWPLMVNFMPKPEKHSVSRGLYTDAMQADLDPFVGQVMELLSELGIAENTLLIAMADNGPMAHNPPPGLGMTETIFRGGKGDFTEGGIRVPAFARWPGVIEPGQVVGDIIHETDLFTTFARLGNATGGIPTDRVIDGVDQTAIFLEGDTNGRRDYVHVYTGPVLGASIKGDFKRHWISGDPGDVSGVAAAYFYLPHDTREHNPLMVHTFHYQEAFLRMRARHELWMKKYPNHPGASGPAFTGLSNARPETMALSEPPVNQELLPFDPLEYIDHELPWSVQLDPDIGD